jgi:pimeloyl-ACP methyl ester carboxylesterase
VPPRVDNDRGPEPRARTVVAGDVELHVLEAGEGFPVVLAHGFPDLAYTWRHQIPALAREGYRAMALDQRGYGRSSRPEAVDAYDIYHLTDDLLRLLDDLGEERAVFVGHDWGALVVWALAQIAPERMAGVVALGVPFLPRGTTLPTTMLRQFAGDQWFLLLYVQEPGIAEADLGRDVRATLRRMLAGLTEEAIVASRPPGDHRGIVDRLDPVAVLPPWLAPDELDHYVSEFSRTGFTGGLNWFRNFDRNWKLTRHLAGATIDVPSLFVAGEDDPLLIACPPALMDGWLNDHRGTVLIEGASHWVHQEKPDAVSATLLDFLTDVAPREASPTTARAPAT